MKNIVKVNKEKYQAIINFYNNEIKDTIYKEIDSFIFENEASINLALYLEGELIGFANGVKNNELGYITCVVIKKNFRRKGYGTLLLNELENILRESNVKKIREIFFNPINLPWYIPNTNFHMHPGVPAVQLNSSWYNFLLKNGYIDEKNYQNGYYLNLDDFIVNEAIKANEQRNKENGLEVLFYDKNKHFGFTELFTDLRNPTWHRVVLNNLEKKDPLKMLVIVRNNEILGWTGPLDITGNGRGYFAGIGIKKEIEGNGLGTVLFNRLVMELKNIGAKYMTLFTGENNKAKYIYLKTGFKEVEKFAIMYKEL